MARITVRRDFKLANLFTGIDPADMREIGEGLAVKIENRTLAGHDENNKAFVPYAPGYAKRKFGKRTVDLHQSGDMFEQFGVISATSKGFTLGFRTKSASDKALWHDTGAGNLPERKFLGIPKTWIRELRDKVVAAWKKRDRS